MYDSSVESYVRYCREVILVQRGYTAIACTDVFAETLAFERDGREGGREGGRGREGGTQIGGRMK
jgi:hypothetical protein